MTDPAAQVREIVEAWWHAISIVFTSGHVSLNRLPLKDETRDKLVAHLLAWHTARVEEAVKADRQARAEVAEEGIDLVTGRIEAAVAAERERCAQVVESIPANSPVFMDRISIASAIRLRGREGS